MFDKRILFCIRGTNDLQVWLLFLVLTGKVFIDIFLNVLDKLVSLIGCVVFDLYTSTRHLFNLCVLLVLLLRLKFWYLTSEWVLLAEYWLKVFNWWPFMSSVGSTPILLGFNEVLCVDAIDFSCLSLGTHTCVQSLNIGLYVWAQDFFLFLCNTLSLEQMLKMPCPLTRKCCVSVGLLLKCLCCFSRWYIFLIYVPTCRLVSRNNFHWLQTTQSSLKISENFGRRCLFLLLFFPMLMNKVNCYAV